MKGVEVELRDAYTSKTHFGGYLSKGQFNYITRLREEVSAFNKLCSIRKCE